MKLKIYQNVTIFDAVKDMMKAIDNSDFCIEHIVLVPDRFSLICEKLLLEILPSKALFNVRVVSITKYSTELLEKFGVKIKKGDLLSNGETLLLTQKAIENVKGEFKTFKKNRISFCFEVSKLISQFKSSRVSPEQLNEKANGLAGLKYHDLKLIYQEYQRLLGDKLDANERLNLLNDKFQSGALENTKIHFAGFEAFTSESYVLLKNLIKGASEVNLTLAKPLDEGNDYIYEKDIFEKVKTLCGELGISAEVISKKAEMPAQKEAVVRGLYSYQKVNCENKGYYNLYSCMNISEEVEVVAKMIRYKVYNGERYKNIAIAVGGLDKYITQIENIFDRYQIPYYIDSALTADKTLLGNLIFCFFEVVLYGYSQDRLVNLLSNFLLGDNKELIEKCQRFNIDNKQKYKKFIEKDFVFASELDKLSSVKTAGEFERVVLKILSKVQENFESVMSKLEEDSHIKERNINVQVEEIVKEQLELISRYYVGDISAQEYQKMLSLLLSFRQVSTVPTFLDGVMIGDATESMFSNVNILFVMGAQNLPAVSGDNGLLSDEDLGVNFDCVIEPTIKMINRRNRFKLFSLLTLGKDKLILTYQFLSEEGKKNELPSFITSLNKIFNQIELRAGNIFFNRNSNDKEITLLSSDLSHGEFKKVDKENLSPEKARKLMFADDKARVTQIENYFACPFKHFLSYGLKLKEFEKAEVDGRDVGNICHAGAEAFIKYLIKSDFNFNINLKKFIDDNFEKFIDDKLKERLELLSEKDSYIQLVKLQLLSILKNILRECKVTVFRPKYVEKEFESKFEKSNITLIGRADRIDVAGDYFRIIDYKTGRTGNVLKELYFGEKLQLFLYQKEAKEKFKLSSAGGYYFVSGLDYSKEEEKVILKGLSPNDNEVVLMLDGELSDNEKSSILSIAKDSKGGFKGAGISKIEISTLCDYAYKVAEKAVDEICQGFVSPKPCDGACEFCKFHTICGYKGEERNLGQEIKI